MRTCTKTEKSQYALWGHVLKWKKKTNIWHKSWNANNENTVVLGRMYRSILSSCLGIEGQYGPPPSLRSGGQPVLRLNSSAWWQYWPIHPPQNYSIPPIFIHGYLRISRFDKLILSVLRTYAVRVPSSPRYKNTMTQNMQLDRWLKIY